MREHFEWTLPQEIANRLSDVTYGHQRAIYEAKHLLIILHAPPAPNETERTNVVFLRTPDGKYFCNGRQSGEVELVQLLESYQTLLDQYNDDYDHVESSKDLYKILAAISPLNRASTNLHNALQAAREYEKKDKFLIEMRDRAHDLSRNFELLLADAKLALDFRIAQNSDMHAQQIEKMAAAQHKLNVLAAITFPLIAVATLFGMNLMSGLEDQSPLLFWGVFAICLLVGVTSLSWVIKNNK
jgi:Mg2+ and Co2+ transporter CorA